MDLWIWVVSGTVAATLIVLIERIVKYAVVFRRRQPKHGVPLEEYIARAGGRIPAERALGMLEPVVRRLALFHTNGRAHLNVCPQRIVVVPGSQKLVLLAPEGGGLVSGYSAPEQYRGEAGPGADVYAAACVLYRMAAGKTPPEAMLRLTNDAEVKQDIADMNVAEDIKRAWLRALSPEPEARFKNCGMLAMDLYPKIKTPAEQV